jgi:hypothetical protein
VTVEKAKERWHNDKKRYANMIKDDIKALMSKTERTTKRTSDWATMKDGRENNLIALIMNDWYDDIHDATPKLKPDVPGQKQKRSTRSQEDFNSKKPE